MSKEEVMMVKLKLHLMEVQTNSSAVAQQADILDLLHIMVCGDGGAAGCQSSRFFLLVHGRLFWLLLLLCLIGNASNIIVYRLAALYQSVAVRMLAVKAVVNTLFVVALIPDALRYNNAWRQNTESLLERLYFHTYATRLWVANIFGSTATWLVVVMTLERFLYIVYPVRSKELCTIRNFYVVLALVLVGAGVLHVVFFVTRYVTIIERPKEICVAGGDIFDINYRQGYWYELYEGLYHWLILALVIVVPLSLMTFMSVFIAVRLFVGTGRSPKPSRACVGIVRPPRRRRSEQRRCVTRISLVTTACHLCLEGPSVYVYTMSAIHGAGHPQGAAFCAWHVTANLMGLLNSSVLFFIYLGCSPLFRELFMRMILLRPLVGAEQMRDRTRSYGTTAEACSSSPQRRRSHGILRSSSASRRLCSTSLELQEEVSDSSRLSTILIKETLPLTWNMLNGRKRQRQQQRQRQRQQDEEELRYLSPKSATSRTPPAPLLRTPASALVSLTSSESAAPPTIL